MTKTRESEVWRCHCGYTEPYTQQDPAPTHTHNLFGSAIDSESWYTTETVHMHWAKIEYFHIDDIRQPSP